MMKTSVLPLLSLGLVVALLSPASAVGQDSPINIESVSLEISRNGTSAYVAFTPDETGDANIARETDVIRATITLSDADFPDDEIWIRKQSTWLPFGGQQDVGPEPPAVEGDSDSFVNPLIDWNTAAPDAIVVIEFTIPEWVGVNYARFRQTDPIEWDVHWLMSIEASNAEEPGDDEPVSRFPFEFWAVENTGLRPPNPPPVADAGSDQEVVLNPTTGTVQVTLDASRSVDLTNAGFDPNDANVYDKDTLNFVWEWVSGPVEIQPAQITQDPNTPALSYVTLNTASAQPYVFRVLVDDGVNAVPSTDSVNVVVRATAPTNAAPIAVLSAPAGTVPVGGTITLDASASWDPDAGDTANLVYRWRQTNEVGGDLTADQLRTAFQPVSGRGASVATWRAISEGTYYFRLLVTDQPEVRDSLLLGTTMGDVAAVSVVVAGTTADATKTTGDPVPTETPSAQELVSPIAPTCGAGLAPLAIVPICLLLIRRFR